MSTNGSSLCIIFYFLTFLSLLNVTNGAYVCPSSESIAPCICNTIVSNELDVYCEGPMVTQVVLENVFSVLRSVNNVSLTDPTNPWLPIYTLLISKTALTSLDVTPLTKIDVQIFYILDNAELATITPALGDLAEPFKFQTNWLTLSGGKLGDVGVANFLNFLIPDNLQYLNIESVGSEGDILSADLPLTNFTRLRELNFGKNNIRTVTAGQFKNNTRLTLLQLNFNQIDAIDPQAFWFPDVPPEMTDWELKIDLSGNQLIDDGISAQSGLDRIGRPVRLVIEKNLLEFISAANFEPFLQAHEKNQLYLTGNFFICDERMRWLRDGKADFEPRVYGIWCENDPGRTIFNTDLLS